MKIATFNINNINKRLPNLLAWLKCAAPDVVCLQELKSADAAFPQTELLAAGYHAVWRGERSWNGVAILARDVDPVLTRSRLPGDPADLQSRYIEAAVAGVLIGCLYLPNGNPQPGPKFDYKLAWFERLIAHAATLRASGLPVVLAGDFNVVPTDADIYPTRSWAHDALLQPQSRAAFSRLLDQGWTDAIRAHHPAGSIYTFWDYKRERWPRDAGLRLDHLLLSDTLAGRLTAAGVDRCVRGEVGASDHAPAWITLATPGPMPTRRRSDRGQPAAPPGVRSRDQEVQMTTLPKKGDKVKWGSSQGEVQGTVEKVVKETTKIKGHTAKATKEKPEVLVRSDKTGKPAVHKPEALKKT